MKLSISALVAIAIAGAAPASAAFVGRVEGEVTNTPATVCLIDHMNRSYKNSTALAPRAGEVVSCYGFGTKADRGPIVSVIDDFCGKVIDSHVANGQTVWTRYNYGSFTVYVSGEAINGCNFVIDGNCNRLLRLPVDGCNKAE
ncbi:hypothetical protein B0H17DRAFT_1027778 [Mycena rosella]|uniref:Uncharacterized protein n=1 Tax=Mycena rosella TaxID=1033263 RepID=A0AAD7MCW6_MYCRO|nr:hypothetical protein B0H17DRAFT_1027778 [Mycena rosella]